MGLGELPGRQGEASQSVGGEEFLAGGVPRPRDPGTGPRGAHYKRYFDLIASGKKTVEIRVAYPSNKRLAAGQLLKFTCRVEECLTRITRVAHYTTFDETADHQNVASVNPAATRAEQLATSG